MTKPYFELQAKIGITKHLGGAKATDRLIELCHIDKDSYVLEVGCGTGLASAYIARKTGCNIIGIDLSKEMVESAKRTAKIKKVDVEYKVANAEKLPFKDNTFDAVISESVTAFTNKSKAVKEYVRVVKKGGYVGLNETSWLKKPTKEMVDYIYNSAGGVVLENYKGWRKYLEDASLTDIVAESYKLKIGRYVWSELKLVGFGTIFRAWGRLIKLLITSKKYRKIMKDMYKVAIKKPKHFMDYFGYGVYVGKKI